ncbi:MAG: TRAP transporter small permease [Piscinibacter sp.]|nr:TRAP transporter small permease [Piscinibacter sp.]
MPRPGLALHAAVAWVDRGLAVLAALALVGAFVAVSAGVLARLIGWDLPGTDAYAGYAIAAALFLALPQTLRRQEHIRVTLLLDKLGPRGRAAFEWWALGAGFVLAVYLAVYAVRLVWMSQAMHDVSPAADATPLWIPQVSCALGCLGFALSLGDALVARWQGRAYFERVGDESAHVE